MKTSRVVLITLLVTFVAVGANAFDCERKGFVIGLGGGSALWIYGSGEGLDMDLGMFEFGGNFLAGYAYDNQNVVLFLTEYVQYHDTLSIYTNTGRIYHNDITIYQAFIGFGYARYFSSEPKSPFVTVGLGLLAWLPQESFYMCSHGGPAVLVGGGYEFTRHLQFHGSLSFGWAKRDGNDYKHANLMFTLTGVLY